MSLKKLFQIEAEKQVNLRKQKLLSELKAATPVDTGNARDSWVLRGNTIVNEVEYMSYLNEGTSNQAPSRFIERTVLSSGFIPNGSIVRSL